MADTALNRDEVTLTVGSRIYGGWKEITVTRTLEAIAGSFELTVAERWPGQQAVAAIRPGDRCSLAIGPDTVITGYIDEVAPEYDSESHQVKFRGRDATGDLVDCSAIHDPGTWIEPTGMLDIVRALCQPFGIKVTADVPLGTFSGFALQRGETVFEVIERMSARAGVLPVSDGKGGLKFTRAGTGGRHAGIILGENIEQAAGTFSNKDRFSEYIVLGQSPGSDFVSPETTVAGKGTAKDPGITRYRPLIVMANVVDPSEEIYDTRAKWEASIRLGRAWRATTTMPAWRDAGGKLWQPNTIAKVDDDFLGVHSDLLISGVKHTLNDQGSHAELTVTRRSAFDVAPLPDTLIYDPAPPERRLFPGPSTNGGRL